MTDKDDGSRDSKTGRKDRLAAELRANLKRRKEQARARRPAGHRPAKSPRGQEGGSR